MSTFRHYQSVFVARELQGRGQILVSQGPVSEQIIEIVFAFLKIDFDRLGIAFAFADQAWVGPASPDIGVTTNVAENFPKLVRAFPSDGEGSDASRRDTANGPLLGIFADVKILERDREQLVD